jgi:translation initiation factor IF-2
MPQTVEAIKQAKAMAVPMIVAVNKIDKVDISRLEVIRRELSQHGVLPEDWGGDVVLVPLSAKTGKGVDQLLDMIILQSQLMELSSGITGLAQGYVLESKLEKGRGPVATLLCQQGTLKVGDHFVCGSTFGKVTSLVDSLGRRVQQATPSIPVLVAGFSALPNAGDFFEVVSQQDYKKSVKDRAVEHKPSPGVTFTKSEAFNIVIKTDSNSSKEAILGSLQKISRKFEKKFNVVYSGVGPINESDVDFAHTTGATIWSLHVKPEPSATILAHKEGVKIHVFDIIYKLLESLEALAEGAKEIKMIKTKIGEATVRQVFDIKGLGVIAGCYVSDGRFSKDGFVVVLRGNRKIGEGKIKSLQRDKKPVKEVHTGYECGFLVDGCEDFMIDDRIECFINVPETSKK